MIKHFNQKNLKCFLHLNNNIWTANMLPNNWKLAHVLPQRKPNKDNSEASSYRPVRLTNSACKITEKIITARLREDLENRKILDKHQSGFRKNKSTIDNLIRLQQEIVDGTSEKQHVMCVFFDMEKAFDNINKNTILDTLKQYKYEGNVLYFIKDFLVDRKFAVRVGASLSQPYSQEQGTPQGSVISPLLFILAINSIQQVIKAPVKHLLFADDLVIFLRGKDIKEIEK